MTTVFKKSQTFIAWLIVIPTIAWFYIGLFVTMSLWYPSGVTAEQWQSHLFHFSVVYAIWLLVFFSYRLFDADTLRIAQSFVGRLLATIVICFLLAALYFYFQPALLITPRRFLIVHVLITGLGILLWYVLMRRAAQNSSRRPVYAHSSLGNHEELADLLKKYQFLGLQYTGVVSTSTPDTVAGGSMLILPAHSHMSEASARELFELRNLGVRFIEYHDLYESLTRTVHLSVLTDLWFLQSVDYGKHALFDLAKRVFDVLAGIAACVVGIVTFPIIALLIKLTSRGPVLFTQQRVGQFGKPFTLYKYRTMTIDSPNNTWAHSGQTVTWIGKFLRATRLDELPQAFNILKGNMSIVGPRPEQVHIVEQLRQQIPYYDERHIVKPGLTGWAQIHIYAASLEETRKKLQYDIYYIKHRGILFDLEIILKTIYNIISFAGK